MHPNLEKVALSENVRASGSTGWWVVLAAGIPLLIALVLLSLKVHEKTGEAEALRDFSPVRMLNQEFSQVVNELQQERGRTALYLRAPNELLKRELECQRESTDSTVEKVNTRLSRFDLDVLPANTRNAILEIQPHLHALKATRELVDSNALAPHAAIELYSTTVARILSLAELNALASTPHQIAQGRAALSALARGKDYVGQEGALIGVMMLNGQLQPGDIALIHRNESRQDLFFRKFAVLSSEEEREKLASIERNEAVVRVRKMRDRVERDEVTPLLTELQGALGYGGFFHHFKNFILRGDRRYFESFKTSLRQVELLLGSLEERFAHSSDALKSLDSLSQVIHLYELKIEEAALMHGKRARISAIDAAARVDDTTALSALEHLGRSDHWGLSASEWFKNVTRKTQLLHQQELRLRELLTRREDRRLRDAEAYSFLYVMGGVSLSVGVLALLLLITQKLSASVARNLALAKESQAANVAKGKFLATMSHEIRTPMNGVRGMTNLLLETELTGEQQEYADALRTSGDALLVLIDDILDYSKMEAGKMEIEAEPFELRKMTEHVDSLMSLKAEDKGLRFAVVVERSVPNSLKGDVGRLQQVLINLANNAVKFTEQGEVTLRVSVEREDRDNCELIFSLVDRGIGISKEAQEKLFRRFIQADSSTTRQFGGTGLGLSICKQLCELMGGEIGVESEEGKGSTFWCRISFEKLKTSGKILRLKGEPRVLLISEPCDCREGFVETISALGASVVVASTPLEGVTKAAQALAEERGFSSIVFRTPVASDELVLNAQRLAGASLVGAKTVIVALPIMEKQSASRILADLSCIVVTEPTPRFKLVEVLQARSSSELLKNSLQKSDRASFDGRILLVDDNKINRLLGIRLLEGMDLDVTTCEDGQAAINAIASGHFDVVLMDCQMPIMDGLEATRCLRALGGENTAEKLPILALTAGVMQGDREACLEAGMNEYLTKPIKKDQLQTVLSKYLPRNEKGLTDRVE